MVSLVNFVQILGATSEEPTGIAALGIDPLAILAQAATFLLLFFIIKKFALDKIVKTLEDRRKTIDDGVRLGREMEAKKERLSHDIEKQFQKARHEADEIIAQSREEAGAIIRSAQEDAIHKADALLADAQAKISEQITQARADLEHEVLSLVAEATAIIAEEKLDAKKDEGLITRALAKVRNA